MNEWDVEEVESEELDAGPRPYASIVSESGSVELGAATIAIDYEIDFGEAIEIATITAKQLIEYSPQQLQGSFTHVCMYHRFNEIAMEAMRIGDLTTALKANSEISKLLQAIA